MNNVLFRALVFLMSVSLIGIIAVQIYWFNSSIENNQEQFKLQVKQVLANVSEKLHQQELMTFIGRINNHIDSTGVNQVSREVLEFGYYQRNSETNETIIYSNSLISQDFNISPSFFDNLSDSVRFTSLSSNRQTRVYSDNSFDAGSSMKPTPDLQINKSGRLNVLTKAQYELSLRDIAETYPIQRRVDRDKLKELLTRELVNYGIETPFEFGICSNGLVTKVRSDKFKMGEEDSFEIAVLTDNEGNSKYQLVVNFPEKKLYIFSNLIGISALSLVFTLVIVIAYSSALNQLIKQRQISEIKTDFINNMTHEFKTPIATINLALDAIKNPRVIENKEMVHRYLQMIRDENKRMHAQVENVLRISKLEKKELDIAKESMDVNELIEDAIEHVHLLAESRNGVITPHFDAERTTCLVNDVHFTNVLVNILENAIKYSPDEVIIDVYTENIKDFLIIKIADKGAGMSKAAQKRIFEKFYREHTGDIHNVKGHGLGLAYVKRMIEEHNAEIFVESEKGKGSTFIIKIPLIN